MSSPQAPDRQTETYLKRFRNRRKRSALRGNIESIPCEHKRCPRSNNQARRCFDQILFRHSGESRNPGICGVWPPAFAGAMNFPAFSNS
jgi:hypothetical protein